MRVCKQTFLKDESDKCIGSENSCIMYCIYNPINLYYTIIK